MPVIQPIDVGAISVALQHSVTAGNQFDGTTPSGILTYNNGVYRYPTGTHGGLFDFAQKEPIIISGIQFHFAVTAAVTSWTLYVVDDDGDQFIAYQMQAPDGKNFMVTADERFVLGLNQKLKLVTTGATEAMKARVYAKQERTFNL